MAVARPKLPERVMQGVRDAPAVRPEAVARGRTLLEWPGWCPAEEVASKLVECYVCRRIP